MADLNAFMDSVNEYVTGTVRLRLYKGNVSVLSRESPYALYDPQLAGFGESGGLFSQQASPGFIELWSLQTRMAHRIRQAEGRTRSCSTRHSVLSIWKLAVAEVRRRYARQAKVGAMLVLVSLVAAGYMAKRSSE